MATESDTTRAARTPLSRARVLEGAVDLADESGIEALTMRHLAQRLGVEAMSLYYHVANKEALLDGVVDLVVAEINEAVDPLEGPASTEAWKEAMRRRILTARQVMLRHRWAPPVIEQRSSMSPEILRYHDGLLGIFIDGGFSYDLAHHAMHALGSRALGFTQELFQPDDDAGEAADMEMLRELAPQLPHLVGMLAEISHDDPSEATLGWCDDQTEFEFGLDLLLDGLDRLRRNG